MIMNKCKVEPKLYVNKEVNYVSRITGGKTKIFIISYRAYRDENTGELLSYEFKTKNGNYYLHRDIEELKDCDVPKKKTKKQFLDDTQVDILEGRGWNVKANGFRVTLYANEYSKSTWNSMCYVIGCSANEEYITVLGFGHKPILK
jgi:hypothetical protein